jgi:two-component system, chemotaxis family, response regulator Rcp1
MSKQVTVKPLEILLVEDNPGDVRLTREALKDGKILNNINSVENGIEALEYLNRRGKFSSAVRPDIILLDLNLPRKNGSEVLAEIKRDNYLKNIPVVILSSSKAEEDIFKTYNLQANCYICKPVDIYQFMKVIQVIDGFWFNIVTLPQESSC